VDTVAEDSVVDCKIPWKETRWFRVESAIFLFTRRVLAFFRGNPANSFNQTDFFYPARLFSSIIGSISGEPRETGRGGAQKRSKNRRVLFSRYLARNDGGQGLLMGAAKNEVNRIGLKGALRLWSKRYGWIKFAQAHERVLTKGFRCFDD